MLDMLVLKIDTQHWCWNYSNSRKQNVTGICWGFCFVLFCWFFYKQKNTGWKINTAMEDKLILDTVYKLVSTLRGFSLFGCKPADKVPPPSSSALFSCMQPEMLKLMHHRGSSHFHVPLQLLSDSPEWPTSLGPQTPTFSCSSSTSKDYLQQQLMPTRANGPEVAGPFKFPEISPPLLSNQFPSHPQAA